VRQRRATVDIRGGFRQITRLIGSQKFLRPFRSSYMYAIFRTGGKQFRAEPGRSIRIPSLDIEPGESITFDEVLLGSSDNEVKLGVPLVDGASIKAEVVGHGKGEKIIIFKHKRRKNYRRKQGHRQKYTEVRINEVNLG
jgi:large subunit ribosomal protein L21